MKMFKPDNNEEDREIILQELETELARAFELLSSLPDDFLPDRGQEPPQDRERP